MPNHRPDYYLAPHPITSSDESALLAWANLSIKQGEAFLQKEPAYQYIKDGLDIVNGELKRPSASTLSDVTTEQTVRNLKELIAAQTNIRIIPAFKTEIAEFSHQQNILNKLYMGWQSSTFADRVIRSAWQYAAAAGTGYVSVAYDPTYWGPRRGDIVLNHHGPLDVLPVGLPANNQLQKAYTVAVRVPTPYHELVNRYPTFRDRIKPTHAEGHIPGGVISSAVKFATGVLSRFGPAALAQQHERPWESIDVYYMYVDDRTINNTGEPIMMGTPGTSWEYTVPSMESDIETGTDSAGNKLYRKAAVDDCRLYPTRRLIICTRDCILNPDFTQQVSPCWYEGVPVVQLRADDWAWGFLGFPLTKAGISLEKANVEIMRGVVDSTNVRMSPPRAYDRNTMSQALASSINTRAANQVVGLDMTFGTEQLKPLLPADYYTVPQQVLNLMAENEGRIKHQMGVADAQALARARQLPSGDSLEKMMEALGPIPKDQSRNMEASIRDLGEMWKCFCFQHYNAARRFQLLGPNGLVEEDYDYNPGTLIPASIAGVGPSYFDRARYHLNNFTFSVTPYSLHEINSLTRKLFHLQLVRGGFPIDWWTLAAVFDIQNFGPVPKHVDPDDPEGQKMIEPETVLDRWIAQKEIESRMVAAVQQTQGGGGAKPGQGRGGGRPPSGQDTPTMEQKSDGRSIIRESKR